MGHSICYSSSWQTSSSLFEHELQAKLIRMRARARERAAVPAELRAPSKLTSGAEYDTASSFAVPEGKNTRASLHETRAGCVITRIIANLRGQRCNTTQTQRRAFPRTRGNLPPVPGEEAPHLTETLEETRNRSPAQVEPPSLPPLSFRFLTCALNLYMCVCVLVDDVTHAILIKAQPAAQPAPTFPRVCLHLLYFCRVMSQKVSLLISEL